jgi:hypothetical protein
MHTVEHWYKAMKAKNSGDWNELLEEDVVFHSPVVFTPQQGKKITAMYLLAAAQVFGDISAREEAPQSDKPTSNFRYVNEIIAGNSACLEFESEVNGVFINGVDLLAWNDAGKLTEVKVMVRPLQAVNMLHQQMQAMLEKMS